MGTSAQAQAGRERARESRLKSARERRMRLDPDRVARDQRIDDAVVDVELAWEARAEAEGASRTPRARPRQRWSDSWPSGLSVKDVVRLTGLDQPTVRRLRQTRVAPMRARPR